MNKEFELNKDWLAGKTSKTKTEDFLKSIEQFYEKNIIITRNKNSDYAGVDNPFKNFELVEFLGICSVETGIMVRICDKISRVANLLHQEAKVKDEKIEDTLSDLSNYTAILDTYLKQK